MPTEWRKSGIEVVGDIPWGTHFCHFYETKEDLFDILIPYFKAGLENNEFCVWVISPPHSEEETREALRRGIPDVDQRMAAGDIEVLPCAQRYLKDGAFDQHRGIDGWRKKLTRALVKGYAGMRTNGDEAWLTKENWNDFFQYEEKLNNVIVNQRIIVLCTYLLSLLSASHVFDVAHTHEFAIARRHGRWEVLESPDLKQAKAELKRINEELEQRVAEMTRDVKVRNRELRELAARFAGVAEEERRRLSRELHDSIGQNLVTLSMDMKAISDSLTADSVATTRSRLGRALNYLQETIGYIRDLMVELRPPDLDDYGLAAALRWYADRFAQRTEAAVSVDCGLETLRLPPEVETAFFRIAQEALTNVARHASANRVELALQILPDLVRLTVVDNGVGFDPDAVPHPLGVKAGWGLITMWERAKSIGGGLRVESTSGKGTRITVELERGPNADTSPSG